MAYLGCVVLQRRRNCGHEGDERDGYLTQQADAGQAATFRWRRAAGNRRSNKIEENKLGPHYPRCTGEGLIVMDLQRVLWSEFLSIFFSFAVRALISLQRHAKR
jgi:hypothetical protein